MNVLQICLKPPVPFKDGGCIAMNSITQGLISKNIQVKVLAISTDKHPFEQDKINEEYLKKTEIESVFINTNLHPKDALISLLKGESYNISRFFSKNFEQLISTTLKQCHFDVVHLESLFVTPYISIIRNCFKGKIVLRTHNVEHLIWKELAINEQNLIKKIYLKTLSKQLKKYEISILNKVDAIVSISSTDSAVFRKIGCKKPIKDIAIGIEIEKEIELKNKGFFFLGSLDWKPNIDGINWLNKYVAPKLDAKVKIAGRNVSTKLKLDKNAVLVGEIASAKQFMQQNGIMLVPLFSGSGIRIKIIEAMAWGIPVVATSKAVEGLNVINKKHILIADNATQFIENANQLFADKSFAKQLITNAQNLIKENYSSSLLSGTLVQFYTQI